VQHARQMRKRVIDQIPMEEKELNIKLGRGGLRDVEFTVQLLQLVHGVVDETLRDSGTFPAFKHWLMPGCWVEMMHLSCRDSTACFGSSSTDSSL
jgi:glutamine synthetase adenylyltransferase